MTSRVPRQTQVGFVLVAAVLVLLYAAHVVQAGGRSAPTTTPSAGVPTATPTPRAVRAVIVGDSYFAPIDGNPTPVSDAVAKRMGWELDSNFSVGGTGYIAKGYQGGDPTFGDYTTNVVAAHPDVVLIEGGGNDTKYGGRKVKAAASTMLSDLRAALPSAKIIVFGPLYSGSNPDGAPIQQALEAAAKGVDRITYINPDGWFPGVFFSTTGPGRDLIGKDRVHPNEKGAAMLTTRTVAALKPVVQAG